MRRRGAERTYVKIGVQLVPDLLGDVLGGEEQVELVVGREPSRGGIGVHSVAESGW